MSLYLNSVCQNMYIKYLIIVSNIRKVTDTPVAVGFGINTPEQATKYANLSDGVIVGSAIVKIIAEHGENAGKYIYEYVKSMVDAIS